MLALAACNREIILPEATPDNGNVVLDFSVVVPEAQTATRTLSEPAIENLTILVFDENGMLIQTAAATPKTTWGISSTDPVEFTVNLTQHPTKCALHFVANCPASLPEEGSEAVVMTSLTTGNSQDAYWQRVEVDNLMAANDLLEQQLEEKLTEVPLIRNFAKVSVQSTAADFVMKGYALINTPLSGTVVPYNTETGEFEAYNEGGTGLDYEALKQNGYSGFMPAGVTYDTAIPASVTNTAPLYTYESRLRGENNVALIVFGAYKGEEGYYKVDFTSTENQYNNGNYEILRNLHYIVTINSVVGPGYGSASAAAAAAAGNNINASTDTQNLLNISDGTSRLFVDEIVKHVVSSAETFQIRYRYEPQIKGDPDNSNPVITTEENGEVIASYAVAAADQDGWRTITVTPKALPTEEGENFYQEITIAKGNLSRTVKIYLHQPYDMTVTCSPTTVSSVKASVIVRVSIPGNLPPEVFPLVFDIEDTQLCLSPDASYTAQGAVPVTTDPSIINPAVETFHYRRTLTWDQYSAIEAGATKTFETRFLSNKTAQNITVYVKNPLFGEAVHN